MKHSEVVRQYQKQLAWAQMRLSEVRNAWARRRAASSAPEIILSTDTMAIQLRMALESIAFATLVTNKEAYTKARPKGHSDWNARRILKAIEEINPNFYPWPYTIAVLTTGTHIAPSTSAYLTQAAFVEAYDAVGEMLHAPSPLKNNNNYAVRGEKLVKWGTLAERLVRCHVVELPGAGFVFATVDAATGACRAQLAEPLDGAQYIYRRPID